MDMSKRSCVRLPISNLAAAARAVLCEPDPRAKVARTHLTAADWRAGRSTALNLVAAADATTITTVPERPARPALPQLMAPRLMPRRRLGGVRGRIALLHAVAHIELNAIDLAWDLIGRFAALDWPAEFFDDWVDVAADEARHFTMLAARLNELGASYGDLPAHDGLWEAAMATSHDPLARLAVVPMVLEARGLDVTPAMIACSAPVTMPVQPFSRSFCAKKSPMLPPANAGSVISAADAAFQSMKLGANWWQRIIAAFQDRHSTKRRAGLPAWRPSSTNSSPDPGLLAFCFGALRRLIAEDANALRQGRGHEFVEAAIEDGVRVGAFHIGAQIFHQTIRLQNVRADLVAPANVVFLRI